MQLKPEIVKEIKRRGNKRLRIALMQYFDIVDLRTLATMFKRNDKKLLNLDVLRMICVYLKKDIEEIIDNPEEITQAPQGCDLGCPTAS
jgi:hypothetical protein